MVNYRYIKAWCNMMGSFPYYTELQLDQARKDKAPKDATYKRADGSWSTYKDIKSDNTRAVLANYL